MSHHRYLRAGVLGVVALTGIFVFAGGTPPAAAAVINVACGNVSALRSAITTANATPEPDTIEVTGGPCTFNVAQAAVTQPSGDTGLPIIIGPLIIDGNGATIRRTGSTNYRLVLAATPNFIDIPRVELRELTISNGRLTGSNQNGAGIGGFLANVVLDQVIVSGNVTIAGQGGGIAVSGGSLDMNGSVIAGNRAVFGAGLVTVANNSTNDFTQSSIFFNESTGNTGAALLQNGTTVIENSTIAGNAVPNGTGGVTAFTSAAASPASVTVRSSTLGDNGIAGNPAPGTSLWAIATAGTATITATDTIVVDTDSTAAPVSPPCLESAGGSINSAGGNVEWPTNTCGFESQGNPRVQYQFGGLGGAELFAKLLRDSAAIDFGGADCPPIDQRGEARPAGVACDSGSWETQPPDTTAEGPTSPTNDPQVTFTSSEPDSTFECRVDGGDWQPCTSPFDPGPLDDGSHTVEVRAIDGDGDVDPTPASVTFVVDATAPVVTITSAPSSPTTDPTPTFAFTVEDDSATTTVCQIDDTPPQPCTSPHTTAPLDNGEHTFTVTATDEAGNTGSDSVTFVVDNQPPNTTITSGPSGNHYDPSATFTFTSSEPNSTFECRFDGGAWAACSSPHTVSGYAPGTHTFEVRAIDEHGAVDPTPASRTFTYRECTLIRLGVTLFGSPIVICI